MSEIPLSKHFESYFEIVLAHNPKLQEQIYRIRYDVYCREFQFEPEENYPHGREQDHYDQYSLHCLVRHRVSKAPAGCVRLIKIPQTDPALQLPLERFCGDSLHHDTLQPSLLRRSSICEISRLAVHTAFRRRHGESASPLGSRYENLTENATEEELRTFPLISIALIAASTSLMLLAERPNLFIMAENWLARLLRRVGLDFIQVGKVIDYHGPRAAYFITAEQMVNGMKGELREIYNFVHGSLTAEARHMDLDLRN
jgi:N-acyl amino acid synthase of PEP-CTERM/exosortase system